MLSYQSSCGGKSAFTWNLFKKRNLSERNKNIEYVYLNKVNDSVVKKKESNGYNKIMIINANQPETKNKIVDDFAQEITYSDTPTIQLWEKR